MRIESFKISKEYRGIILEGTCRVILPSTYMITMEKPYKGLSQTEYFRDYGDCSVENIKGTAQWELGRLYEQYQSILYDYDKYKELSDEWERYELQVQAQIEEAITLKKSADAETLALIDFHIKMLERDAKERFYELLDKYDIKPLSLSPSVMGTSIRLIEEEFEKN